MICGRFIAALASLSCSCAAVSCTTANSVATTPQRQPSPAERYFVQAGAFEQQGDPVRAEQYFAMAMRAGYPQALVVPKLLHVCVGASRLRAALGYAQAYLLRHPRLWQLRYLVASLELALDEPRIARAELLRVLAERPDHAGAAALLATLATPEEPP